MPDATIRAKLGLENTDWRATLKASQADLDATKDKAKALAAAVALTEREMADSKGTKEQIARLRELRSEFAQTEQAARRMAAQTARIQAETPAARKDPFFVARDVAAGRARPGSEGGEGGSRAGASEMGHSVRSFTDSLAAGTSPLQAAQMESGRLVQGMGGGVGAIAAVAGVGALVSKLHSAYEEAHGLETALKAAMVPVGGGGENFQSIDLLRKHIEGIKSSLGNTLEADGTFSHAVGQWVQDHVTALHKGGFKNMKRDDLAVFQERKRVTGAQDEIANDANIIADKADNRNALARRRLTDGRDSTVDADIDRGRDEKLGDITREGLPSAPRLKKAAEEEARIAHEAAAKERDEKTRSIALENQIVEIKRAGLNVDIESARARVDAANVALGKGPASGNEHDALQEAVNAANLEVDQAKKVTAEKRDQATLETQIASLRGSSDQVRQKTLELESASIGQRMQAATADEMPGLTVEQARNQQQQDEFTKAQHLREIDRGGMEDRANAGRGPGAQVDLINRESQRNDDRRSWNTNENGGDADVSAQLDESAAQLKRTKEDILFSEQQTLAASKAQTQEMQLRASGNDKQARVVAIQAQYEAEIAAAIHAGRTDLAEQARIREAMALDSAHVADDETPTQRAARERAATAEAKRVQNYHDHHGTHDADALGGSSIHNADGPGGSLIPTAGTDPDHAAVNSPDNGAGMGFKDIGSAHMPDRSFLPTVPAAGGGADASGFDGSNPFDGPTPLTLTPPTMPDLGSNFGMVGPAPSDHPPAPTPYNGPSAEAIGSAITMAMLPYVTTVLCLVLMPAFVLLGR